MKPHSLKKLNDFKHQDVKRAAWIRVGALGDLLVGTVNLADTHQLFPEAEILVMGDKIWTEILSPQQWPRVRIVVIEKRGSLRGTLFEPQENSWVQSSELKPLSEFFKTCDATVNTRYESLRYAWGPWTARVKIRYGMTHPYMKWVYTHWSPFLGKDPEVHERDLATFIIRGARKVSPSFFKSFFEPFFRRNLLGGSSKKARKRIEEMILDGSLHEGWTYPALPRLKMSEPQNVKNIFGLEWKSYWIVNPTASRIEKAWPAKKFRELVLKLKAPLEAINLQILVVGSPKESAWLQEVAGVNFRIVQPNSISELTDLVDGAAQVITNTSSMQFIAASTQTRVLTLMGNANPKIWGPLSPHDEYLKPPPIDTQETDIFKLEQLYFDMLSVNEVYETALKFINGYVITK